MGDALDCGLLITYADGVFNTAKRGRLIRVVPISDTRQYDAWRESRREAPRTVAHACEGCVRVTMKIEAMLGDT